jgi:hypothetical protein
MSPTWVFRLRGNLATQHVIAWLQLVRNFRRLWDALVLVPVPVHIDATLLIVVNPAISYAESVLL